MLFTGTTYGQLSIHDIGVFFNGTYTYRTLINEDNSKLVEAAIENRNGFELAKPSYQIGLSATFFKKGKLELLGAISLTNYGEQLKTYNLTYGDQIDPQRGFAYTTSDYILHSFTYNFYYLDIIPTVKYNLLDKKIKLYTSLSPEVNFYLGGKTKKKYSENGEVFKKQEQYDEPSNPMTFSGAIGLGIKLPLGEKFSLSVEPNYRRMLTNKLKSSEVNINSKYYSWGLKTGLSYNF